MARRNRRRRAQVRPATIGMAAIVLTAVAPWLIYCVLGMRVEQANAQIRLLEQERLSQTESLRRCEAEWNRQRDPVRLDEAIARNGLRHYDPTKPALVVDANEAYNLAADYGLVDIPYYYLEPQAVSTIMAFLCFPGLTLYKYKNSINVGFTPSRSKMLPKS